MSGIECPMCTNVPGLEAGKGDSGKVPKVNCSDGLDLCMSLKGKMTVLGFTQSIELKNCSNNVLCDSASDYNGTNNADSEVQKPIHDCVFRCRQSSKRTSYETKVYFNGFKRSWIVICDWWFSIRFACFCVARFVACERNYDWRQRKTQLWRRRLNFGVRMFVKSAVSFTVCFRLLAMLLLSGFVACK